MSSGIAVEMASARFMQSAEPAQVWIRKCNDYNNIVAMNGEQIAASKLPKAQLKSARTRLEDGSPFDEVLGPRGTRIHFVAVRAVTARLNTTEIEVVYTKGDRRLTTCRFPMADKEAQADFLAEARERLPRDVQVVEATGSRLKHAMKPFNLLVLFAVLTIGAQNFFTSDWRSPETARKRLDKMNRAAAPPTRLGRASQHAFVRTAASYPAVQKLFVFGIILLGVVGTVLNALGYTATMAILGGATGLMLLWMFARLVHPPRTMSVVVSDPR